MNRGDIFYIRNTEATGHEQKYYRPVIIVSNNVCNKHSPVVEVVYLTTKKIQKHLPTHVEINSAFEFSIALCEAVYSIDVSRIDKFVGHCTRSEIGKIDRALMISLGLVESW